MKWDRTVRRIKAVVGDAISVETLRAIIKDEERKSDIKIVTTQYPDSTRVSIKGSSLVEATIRGDGNLKIPINIRESLAQILVDAIQKHLDNGDI